MPKKEWICLAKNDRKQTGKLGEQLAVQYVLQLPPAERWCIEARNWRCRVGELDIVAREGDVLVFFEVRTRHAGGTFGEAAESVDVRKQRQVRRTALHYMTAHGLHEVPVRFDVIAVTLDASDQQVHLEHYRNAFS